MSRRVTLTATVIAAAIMLASGCAKPALRDGIYTGQSSEDDDGAYALVTVTVSGNNITGCDFVTVQRDGTLKGEDYGKVNGEISNRSYYDKAQLAVTAMRQYADEYLKSGNLRDVDAVSGATISFEQFNEAVEDALEKAK